MSPGVSFRCRLTPYSNAANNAGAPHTNTAAQPNKCRTARGKSPTSPLASRQSPPNAPPQRVKATNTMASITVISAKVSRSKSTSQYPNTPSPRAKALPANHLDHGAQVESDATAYASRATPTTPSTTNRATNAMNDCHPSTTISPTDSAHPANHRTRGELSEPVAMTSARRQSTANSPHPNMANSSHSKSMAHQPRARELEGK